jgi:hypothetical protein
MKGHGIKTVAMVVGLTVVFGAVFGLAVMGLWNWLVPSLFGGKAIGFWQALGLLLLARILVGGFHGGPGRHGRRRHRMMEHWDKMTPEERERFEEGVRAHWHRGHDAPETAPKEGEGGA